MTDLVKTLESEREKQGRSKTSISKILGISRQAFYAKLSGKDNFTQDQLSLYAKELGYELGLIVK